MTWIVSSLWAGDCWNYAREALNEKVFKKTETGDFENARTADRKYYNRIRSRKKFFIIIKNDFSALYSFNQYYFPYTVWKDTEKYGRVNAGSGHKFYEDNTMTIKERL